MVRAMLLALLALLQLQPASAIALILNKTGLDLGADDVAPPVPQPLQLRSTPGHDVLYHLHIPKVGGISFMNDAHQLVTKHSFKTLSLEGCYDQGSSRKRVQGTMLLLRNPRKHVVSMHDFCKTGIRADFRSAVKSGPPMPETFEGWVQAWRRMQDAHWHGNFTPPATTVNRMSDPGYSTEAGIRIFRIPAWALPPFSPEPTLFSTRDWPVLDGGGTIWHHTKVPFQCYVPLSFQTQRLACTRPMEFPEEPQVNRALSNLGDAFFVGILEQYQASICLLQLKLGDALPSYCDCRDAEKWSAFPFRPENTNPEKLTDAEKVSDETFEEVDRLAQADWQVYWAGWARFKREVAAAEAEHGTKLLCGGAAGP